MVNEESKKHEKEPITKNSEKIATKKISKKAFEQIRQKEVRMLPKCYFDAQNLTFLFISGLSFFIGAFFISLVFDFFYSHRFAQMIFYLPMWTMMAFPYLSMIIAIVAVFIAFWSYRKSRCVCRHENWFVTAFFLLSAAFLGAVASFSFSDYTESPFYLTKERIKNAYFYDKLSIHEKHFWSVPEKGTISGVLTNARGDSWILRDWQGQMWVLTQNGSTKIHPKFEKALAVKSFGHKEDGNIFLAYEIWKW